ncbi:hypothetical protein SSP35_02_03550 [Streptomyces sp. NBRC 110611]|nr:hypothetical protein SSP35_02_03550 [Streptomyces sp. NBRC 110611]
MLTRDSLAALIGRRRTSAVGVALRRAAPLVSALASDVILLGAVVRLDPGALVPNCQDEGPAGFPAYQGSATNLANGMNAGAPTRPPATLPTEARPRLSDFAIDGFPGSGNQRCGPAPRSAYSSPRRPIPCSPGPTPGPGQPRQRHTNTPHKHPQPREPLPQTPSPRQ